MGPDYGILGMPKAGVGVFRRRVYAIGTLRPGNPPQIGLTHGQQLSNGYEIAAARIPH